MSDDETKTEPEAEASGEQEASTSASDSPSEPAKSRPVALRWDATAVGFVGLGLAMIVVPIVLLFVMARTGVVVVWYGLMISGAVFIWRGIARARGVAESTFVAELGKIADYAFGNGPRARSPWWVRALQLGLAAALAAAAVGVHLALNVPEGGVTVSKRDQGARSRRGKTRTKRARPEPFEPRDDAELARLQQRYERVEFESEPIISRWARRQQALVNKAVVVARKQAFEGAPEDPRVIVTGTKCRTIRCRFLLRSPYPHEVELLDRALKRLEIEDEPLWRSYASKRTTPPEGAPPNDAYLEVTVVFTADELEGRSIEAVPADANDEPSAAAGG